MNNSDIKEGYTGYRGRIHYVLGDATHPIKRPAVIIHSCNDRGAWGSGFVVALSRRWPGPEASYRAGSKDLGTITHAKVEDDIWVFNMVVQAGLGEDARVNALALEDCLARIGDTIDAWPYGDKPTIHCPRIGADRGNTDWRYTEEALVLGLQRHDIFVYDLNQEAFEKYAHRHRYGKVYQG